MRDKTGFALTGSHARLECESCHATSVTAALPKTCGGCHRNDDPHEGRLGATCGNCHRSTAWQQTKFDHVAVSGFALAGAHADLQCTVCHQESIDAPLARECAACHGTTDPHNGQLSGRCETCHAETLLAGADSLRPRLDRFPAARQARRARVQRLSRIGGVPRRGRRVRRLPRERRPAWRAASARNARRVMTRAAGRPGSSITRRRAFRSRARTRKVGCASCHQGPVARLAAAADNCGACHRRTDPHGGRFGDDCGSCHTTDTFAEPQRR